MAQQATRHSRIRAVERPEDEAGQDAPCARCHLASVCLPARLGAADLHRLAAIVHPQPPLQRGQRLFRDGERPERLFIVRSGCLRTSIVTGSGEEQVIGFHPPGDVVGFEASLDATRYGSAVALERTSVCAVALGDLRRLSGRLTGLQEQLYRLMGRESAGNRQHMLMMGRPGASRRLAVFLYTWSRRMATGGFSATVLPLPMSREDIASYLGMAHETASRAMSRLHDEGIVEVRGREVAIRDANRLAASAGMPPAGSA